MLKKINIAGKISAGREKSKEKEAAVDEFHSRMAHSIEGMKFYDEDGVKTLSGNVDAGRLDQVIVLDGKKARELKWTVISDPFAEEFTNLTKELKQVKRSPPLYASNFDNSGIAASHVGLYTMILGGHGMDAEEVSEAFMKLSRKKELFSEE